MTPTKRKKLAAAILRFFQFPQNFYISVHMTTQFCEIGTLKWIVFLCKEIARVEQQIVWHIKGGPWLAGGTAECRRQGQQIVCICARP